MLPIKLTIEGLYSYQEQQTIDFAELTDAGLFGIFGETGSGKSSILEAISFALYGETERMNAQEGRSYNMMNLRSNRIYLDFEFLNYENKEYRVIREIKRNTKQFYKTYSPKFTFYEKKGAEWEPVDEKVEDILGGLSYTNFKRTIIIPQGQFKEFIELGEKDRTKMMKEIFQLGQFDLDRKARYLEEENTAELNVLKGQLGNYELINEQLINEKKQRVLVLQKEAGEIRKDHDLKKEKYEKLKAVKADFVLLQNKEVELSAKQEKSKEIDSQEKNLKVFEDVSRIFAPLFKERTERQEELDKNNEIIAKVAKELSSVIKQLKSDEEELKNLQPYFSSLPQKRIEEHDLELLAQTVAETTSLSELNIRIQKGADTVKKEEALLNSAQNELDNLNKQLKELKDKRIDTGLMLQTGNWFQVRTNMKENKEKLQEKIQATNEEIKEINSELSSKYPSPFDEYFKETDARLIAERKKLDQEKSGIEVQQKLSHYAHELHDSTPCPLCGSLEHPDIVKHRDVSEELRTIQKVIDKTEKQREQLRTQQNDVANLRRKLTELQSRSEKEKAELEAIDEETAEHEKLFIWNRFDPNDEEAFNKQRDESIALDKQVEEKEQLIETKNNEREKIRANVEKYKKAVDDFRMQAGSKEAIINANKKNLKVLSFDAYAQRKSEEIEKELNQLRKTNNEVEKKFAGLAEIVTKLKQQEASWEAEKKTVEAQATDIKQKLQSIEERMSGHLASSDLTQEYIEEVLQWGLDAEAERALIQSFKVQLATLKNSISELQTRLQGIAYDEQTFELLKEQFEEVTAKLNEKNKLLIQEEADVKRLEVSFKEKQELQKKEDGLLKRQQNLKVMRNLFRGAGFVDYVSSVFLKQLCHQANRRFHRMTRNQLQLQLNDSNNFEIVDYLNEGRTRSVKTLSGGQAFQVSLSLALALAESVQAKNISERNFFFIDEGFGTQDKEAVQVIFETLLDLNKEKKVVGIISHVEELKDRMPVSLTVINDNERGSLIQKTL